MASSWSYTWPLLNQNPPRAVSHSEVRIHLDLWLWEPQRVWAEILQFEKAAIFPSFMDLPILSFTRARACYEHSRRMNQFSSSLNCIVARANAVASWASHISVSVKATIPYNRTPRQILGGSTSTQKSHRSLLRKAASWKGCKEVEDRTESIWDIKAFTPARCLITRVILLFLTPDRICGSCVIWKGRSLFLNINFRWER